MNPYSTREEAVKGAVRQTNRIVHRWITKQGTRPKSVRADDIKCIFLGNLKKWVLHDHVDFKRFSKLVSSVLVDDSTKTIMGIHILPTEGMYFRDSHKVHAIITHLNSLDFTELAKDLDDDHSIIDEFSSSVSDINFNNIVNIKFD